MRKMKVHSSILKRKHPTAVLSIVAQKQSSNLYKKELDFESNY